MFYIWLLVEFVELSTLLFVAAFLAFSAAEHMMPSLDTLAQPKHQCYVRVLDKDKNLLAEYGEFFEAIKDLKQLPSFFIPALLDTEDRRFYQHKGFDIHGVGRAFLANMKKGLGVEGGSSITQQLAKMFLVEKGICEPNDKNIPRKIYELVLAKRIEAKHTKDEILIMYLNRVYLGGGNFGIAAAAKRFFNKEVQELNLYETARLIGLIQSPGKYVAVNEQGHNRAKQVLANMVANNHLTEHDRQIALLLEQSIDGRLMRIVNYFTDWIVQLIDQTLLKQHKKLVIHTTLDPVIQRKVEKHSVALMAGLGKEWEAESVAVTVCEKDGAIVGFVGGTDYSASQFNAVTSAHRQTGSLFKVILYLTALADGAQPDDIMEDQEVEYDDWAPRNFTRDFRGEMTIEEAFAKSINTISVQLLDLAGIQRMINMARRLGITSDLPRNLGLALGVNEAYLLEMLNPFFILMNNGWEIKPYAINKITADGEVVFRFKHPKEKRILSEKVVESMKGLLIACAEYGTARRSKFGHPIGAKTGTSQNHRDQWIVGFSAHYLTGVRVSTNQAGMVLQTARPIEVTLWRHIMEDLHANLPTVPILQAELEEFEISQQEFITE